jgi:hypothetical protein
MEIDPDEELRQALSTEADERGFDDVEAYVRWILRHREAVLNPPGDRLAGRIERVESEVKRLRKAIESGESPSVAESGESPSAAESGDPLSSGESEPGGTAWFDESRGEPTESSGEASDADFEFGGTESTADSGDDEVSEFAYSSDLEPPGEESTTESTEESASVETEAAEEEPEDGADDDEIADAIADIDLAEEDRPENDENNK